MVGVLIFVDLTYSSKTKPLSSLLLAAYLSVTKWEFWKSRVIYEILFSHQVIFITVSLLIRFDSLVLPFLILSFFPIFFVFFYLALSVTYRRVFIYPCVFFNTAFEDFLRSWDSFQSGHLFTCSFSHLSQLFICLSIRC